MSLFPYLQLQPIDPQDDGSVSELDEFEQDEAFDLTEEVNGEQLVQNWEKIEDSMHEAAAVQTKRSKTPARAGK